MMAVRSVTTEVTTFVFLKAHSACSGVVRSAAMRACCEPRSASASCSSVKGRRRSRSTRASTAHSRVTSTGLCSAPRRHTSQGAGPRAQRSRGNVSPR